MAKLQVSSLSSVGDASDCHKKDVLNNNDYENLPQLLLPTAFIRRTGARISWSFP